ncbi:MAG: hypothetical protein IT338_13670 [Thermomicrobiales bacterium]|nr:hypothetical protein [Thermomicrobiales bacterium]
MGAFSLTAAVVTPSGPLLLPNTFATVDHPFHVARAGVLWREVTSGHLLRWFSQHQGGYPVEFYPLGEAWLEVVIRALSLGTLAAEGAHTLAVILLFLAPGAAFAALAREDGWSPGVALLALVLHVGLPGGWYGGGYTELVQWGLVTNVAGAVAAFAALPALLRFMRTGSAWGGVLASALAAAAIYANPRSALGLGAVGLGAGIALAWKDRALPKGAIVARLLQVGAVAALLAAPELLALARFDDLYAFVHYSGYERLTDYLASSASAASIHVLVLAAVGIGVALAARARLAAAAAACALVIYVVVTASVAFVPAIAHLAPQLEPTRLMPLQRLLAIYLAAVAAGAALSWAKRHVAPARPWATDISLVAVSAILLVALTRPLDTAPDPASPEVSAAGLYAVATSATPQQADLHEAVNVANEQAEPGTAILILGSALSWHQPLWAPLWTTRPLYYDNWLWYWRPDHAGTPGYLFAAGNHYPDPERTLDPDYLARHGIGAVVVTGPVQPFARVASTLRPLRQGIYDVYLVRDPVTTVTFGDRNAAASTYDNHRVTARSPEPGTPIVARVNWHPRWQAIVDGRQAALIRREDGYMEIAGAADGRDLTLVYAVQPLDWIGRALALAGLLALAGSMVRQARSRT